MGEEAPLEEPDTEETKEVEAADVEAEEPTPSDAMKVDESEAQPLRRLQQKHQ